MERARAPAVAPARRASALACSCRTARASTSTAAAIRSSPRRSAPTRGTSCATSARAKRILLRPGAGGAPRGERAGAWCSSAATWTTAAPAPPGGATSPYQHRADPGDAAGADHSAPGVAPHLHGRRRLRQPLARPRVHALAARGTPDQRRSRPIRRITAASSTRKDEPLCGDGYHRLHVLCGESLCSDLAAWLKVGTTALVVALDRSGLTARRRRAACAHRWRRCGASPATRRARRPRETTTGAALTAIDIQRHYLAQAEAHLTAPCMPPWADDGVPARGGRCWIDCEGGPGPLATTLDWAIKLALYSAPRAARAASPGSRCRTWTAVATAADRGAAAHRAPWRAAARCRWCASGTARWPPRCGACREPALAPRGLRWDDFASFLDVRSRLFEIDTRFGQLGREGYLLSSRRRRRAGPRGRWGRRREARRRAPARGGRAPRYAAG